jgi:hypothetical protein
MSRPRIPRWDPKTRTIVSDNNDVDENFREAGIAADNRIKERAKDRKLEQTLADIRRDNDRKERLQSEKDDTELYLEFDNLEKKYGKSRNKGCVPGSNCSIMGGRMRGRMGGRKTKRRKTSKRRKTKRRKSRKTRK